MRSRLPTWIALGALAGCLLATLGQLASPLHLLTHETTQLFGILGAFVVLQLGAFTRGDAATRLGQVLGFAVAMGTGFAAVHGVANQVHACNGAGTQGFFWTTWLPLGMFMAGTGLWIAPRHWGIRLLVFAGMAALTVCHDGLQQAFAPRTVDPFIGMPLFLDQRADMTLPRLHLLSRLWFLGVGLTVSLGWLAREITSLRSTALLAGSITLGATVFGSSHLGLGFGEGAMRQDLSAVHTTEHFTLRYKPGGRAEVRIEAIGDEAEWRLHQLQQAWKLDADVGPYQLLVYDSTAHLYEGTGMKWAHATYGQAALAWWDGLDTTLAHELVHVVHPEISWNPWLLVTPGFVEGTAMAFDDRAFAFYDEAHAEVAGALANGHLPHASVFMHPLGFTAIDEGSAYSFAGSFMGFLVRRYGVDRFLAFQRSLDYEAAYGLDLDGLDAEWRRFLQSVPRSNKDTARARERFDPARSPGIYDKRCPKLGPDQPSAGAIASNFADEDAWIGAAERFRALDTEDPETRWKWGEISALQKLQRHEVALEVLDRIPEGPADQQLRLLNTRIVSLLALARWDELYAAFDARRELEEPYPERVHLERLLHDPEIRDRLGPVLLLGHARERTEPALLALQAERPDDPAWPVLLASRASPVPNRRRGLHRGRDERWGPWLDWLEQAGTCDPDELERGFLHLLDIGDCDDAEHLLRVIRAQCEDTPEGTVVSARSRARWDWRSCVAR